MFLAQNSASGDSKFKYVEKLKIVFWWNSKLNEINFFSTVSQRLFHSWKNLNFSLVQLKNFFIEMEKSV